VRAEVIGAEELVDAGGTRERASARATPRRRDYVMADGDVIT